MTLQLLDSIFVISVLESVSVWLAWELLPVCKIAGKRTKHDALGRLVKTNADFATSCSVDAIEPAHRIVIVILMLTTKRLMIKSKF